MFLFLFSRNSAGGAAAKDGPPASPKGKGKGKPKSPGTAGGARDPTAPSSPGGKRGTGTGTGGGAKSKAKKGKRAGGEVEVEREGGEEIEEIDLSGDAIDVGALPTEVDEQEAEKKRQEEQQQQLQEERAWMGGAWGKDEDHRVELEEVCMHLSSLCM